MWWCWGACHSNSNYVSDGPEADHVPLSVPSVPHLSIQNNPKRKSKNKNSQNRKQEKEKKKKKTLFYIKTYFKTVTIRIKF